MSRKERQLIGDLGALTEKDGEELVLLDHGEEQLPVDVLDRVLLHLVQEPGQQLPALAGIS